ncbi:MAG TPA: acyltransferase family protein [Bradyrhizobium sp.]|jgi:peptidoglycan/LPS O-acetylase OafA/YrhL|nr:acyltransferase family protein [Bradyrhizobium sp.]
MRQTGFRTENTGHNYRADIDGLRAVAVVLVVAFHAFPNVVGGGFVGVDVFFVISGYLITGIILSGLRSFDFSLTGFYARRARRILPALAIVLAGVLAIGWSQLLPAAYRSLGLHALASALFFPNLLSWSEVGYFDAAAEAKPLLHLWSLGVEEQFYLVWPLLLVILSKRPKWLIAILSVIVATSFLYSCYATGRQPAAGFYSPLSRLWELGVGGILAAANLRVRNRSLVSLFGIALIVGSAIFLKKTSLFPGALALIPVSGTALVIVFGSKVLSHKWPVSVGLISYPLYLWHWPLLSFASVAGVTSVPAKVAIVAVSLVLATLTTVFIERPVRFGRIRQSGVAVSTAAMIALIACSALIWRSGGVPWRYPEEIRPVLATMQYDPASDARTPECWLAATSPFEDFSPECGIGTTLIWGDSHAGRLYTGLKQQGIDVAQFARDGCVPSLGSDNETCAQSNAAILRKIAELKPKKVILFAAWIAYNDYASGDLRNSGLAATLIKLKKIADEVVVLGPAPVWSPDLPTQVYSFWRADGRLADRLPPHPMEYHKVDEALAAVSAASDVRFISAFAALCNEDGCLTHTPKSKAELLSWDYGHLTTAGAGFVAALLHLN